MSDERQTESGPSRVTGTCAGAAAGGDPCLQPCGIAPCTVGQAERDRRVALLDAVFSIGPRDMFPATPRPTRPGLLREGPVPEHQVGSIADLHPELPTRPNCACAPGEQHDRSCPSWPLYVKPSSRPSTLTGGDDRG